MSRPLRESTESDRRKEDSGHAFDYFGEDGLRGGEVEPEGPFAPGPERRSVHHRYPRVLGDQRAG